MKLYSHWRSTTSYRVRIALHLKGLPFETLPLDLMAEEQRDPAYAALNPIQGVPTLITEDGTALTQSLAILDYLDAIAPDPPLLPGDALLRAQILGAALVMATDVHPVNNLKVMRYLASLGHDDGACLDWMRHWMTEGLTAYQALLPGGARFSFTDAPGFADICLVAQLYNAHRWGVDLAPFPRLTEIETRCLALEAFQRARPEAQPDAIS